MTGWSLEHFARVADGRLRGSDISFTGVATDTRKLVPGQLFVALSGPHFDGHDFAGEALEQGAAGVVVAAGRCGGLEPRVEVADPLAALGSFAADWRARHQLDVLAVTGSNGKTTVRAMLGRILEAYSPGKVVTTRGNFNNAIGLPLCLLEIRPEHRYGVFELGANHHGEIDALARLARPEVGVITNAAAAHLEGFGSLDGVARAKGELLENLAEDGTAVLNADDPRVAIWRDLAGHRRRIEFGMESGEVRPVGHPELGESTTRAELQTPVGSVEIELALPGRHNLMNALAAAAAAAAVDVSPEAIRRGLEAMQPEPGRLQPMAARNGARLIHDSYNANPASLEAGLEWLSGQSGERWLVLGDMAELGVEGPRAHARAGEQARASGVTRLFTLGSLAAEAAETFGSGAEHCQRLERLQELLRTGLGPEVTVLVKGSRRMGLDRLVEALCEVPPSHAEGEH